MLEIHNFTQNQIDEIFFQQVADVVLKVVNIDKKTEISLAIVGDGRIRKLNKMYRGKNRVTDVLSFQNKTVMPYLAKAFPRMKKGEDMEFIETPDGIKRLGEVIICYSRAKKQAKKAGHSLEKELTILLIHGILHLSGYDHEQNESEAERMEEIERKVLDLI
ncbi:rRNA maturation RNase YbeY [Patescibacteria group bacterium]|nr:rRNA maturation RNase YbeY [Patescibacteria group bacterium]MBU1563679.1 rRNA maturation RNase YbeY [Patescibacteria group bacterium]